MSHTRRRVESEPKPNATSSPPQICLAIPLIGTTINRRSPGSVNRVSHATWAPAVADRRVRGRGRDERQQQAEHHRPHGGSVGPKAPALVRARGGAVRIAVSEERQIALGAAPADDDGAPGWPAGGAGTHLEDGSGAGVRTRRRSGSGEGAARAGGGSARRRRLLPSLIEPEINARANPPNSRMGHRTACVAHFTVLFSRRPTSGQRTPAKRRSAAVIAPTT